MTEWELDHDGQRIPAPDEATAMSWAQASGDAPYSREPGGEWVRQIVTEGPTNTWACACGRTVERWRGEPTVSCPCGAEYNASGQRLRDDWAGNPSNYDSEVSDLDGYEMQHADDY